MLNCGHSQFPLHNSQNYLIYFSWTYVSYDIAGWLLSKAMCVIFPRRIYVWPSGYVVAHDICHVGGDVSDHVGGHDDGYVEGPVAGMRVATLRQH